MITQINREFYDCGKGEIVIKLISEGCGCCSTQLSPTKRNIEEAVQDHQRFILELIALQVELYE